MGAFVLPGLAVLLVAAASVAGLFGIGLRLRRERTGLTAAVSNLHLCLALDLALEAWRLGSAPGRAVPQAPWLAPLALTGAVIYRLFARFVALDTQRRRGNGLPFLLLVPAAASDVLAHGFAGEALPSHPWSAAALVLHVLTGLGTLACCLAAVIRVFRLFTGKAMTGPARLVLWVSATGIVSLSVGMAGLIAGDGRFYAATDAFAAAAVIAAALLSFRRQGVLERFREQAVARRYARSTLAGLDVRGLEDGMVEMVRKTALFKDPDCRLEDLAKRMGLTRHQVSELLNDRMGLGFSSFINDFRVETAKSLLSSRPELTVLAVAYDSGFGNKTSFNEAFRARVGCTPSQFRARRGGKESG